MVLSAKLEREGEDAETVLYGARPGDQPTFITEPVRLLKTLLPDPPPAAIRVSFEWSPPTLVKPVVPAVSQTSSPAVAATPGRAPLRQGDKAKVVVNRRSTVKGPPEKVEQYLGRTGKVVWTTRDGALVEFEKGTTWFSYDELEPVG